MMLNINNKAGQQVNAAKQSESKKPRVAKGGDLRSREPKKGK